MALQLRPSRANHVRGVNQEQSPPIAAEGQTKHRGAAHGMVDDGERAAVAFVAGSVGCGLWRVGQRQAIGMLVPGAYTLYFSESVKYKHLDRPSSEGSSFGSGDTITTRSKSG